MIVAISEIHLHRNSLSKHGWCLTLCGQYMTVKIDIRKYIFIEISIAEFHKVPLLDLLHH